MEPLRGKHRYLKRFPRVRSQSLATLGSEMEPLRGRDHGVSTPKALHLIAQGWPRSGYPGNA